MTASSPTKPGWQTTEFWLTTAITIIGLAYASGVISPDGASAVEKAVAIVASALAAMGYSASRGAVKRSH